MSFSETIFLFFLALIIFGPKKLPEIAKQAGRLLAELRRASNEFKSQIETEIAHLEVEKHQTGLSSSGPPPGVLPGRSLNPPTSEIIPAESSPTLAASAETPPADPIPAAEDSATLPPATSPAAAVADAERVPASQDSHV